MARRRTRSLGGRTPSGALEPREGGAATPALGARLRSTRRLGPLGRLRHRPGANTPIRPEHASDDRRSAADRHEPAGTTSRFRVPGTDSSPGTLVVLPDARRGFRYRALRWAVLVGSFFAGGALAALALPWLETAVGHATGEVRAVAEAGVLHEAPASNGERPRP